MKSILVRVKADGCDLLLIRNLNRIAKFIDVFKAQSRRFKNLITLSREKRDFWNEGRPLKATFVGRL